MVLSCSREATTNPAANATQVVVPNPDITHNSTARLVPADYSQPISLDTANRMIGSYLASVGYPYRDTAVRSLSFDADTLRSYLADSRITTLEFVLAHQLSYINGGSNRWGKNIGMKPGALTIIAVGLDDAGMVIKNSSNGVYEHAAPCPNICAASTDAYLH
jgi:hypothetical protein